ncbi:hypothetical protein K2173_006093 [Erythroxylum novogranatense]|uniref:Uncharacterized protein n=1 Tax=Erythroxylum novogranatense TaxID=1862640 RepID=A0AAV8TCJ9_9ROSI|nr:hypothetical protein K2173_006093 [Erythroxylum novogranatense]
MPTFTAIALDRLLEPGASKSVDKTVPSSNRPPRTNTLPNKKPSISNSNLERRKSTSNIERKVNRPQISPALYATPEATPVPDSPSSFPPSPYIINHKRRGPRLLKSFSEDDVASRGKITDKDEVNADSNNAGIKAVESTDSRSVAFTISDTNGVPMNGLTSDSTSEEHAKGVRPAEENHISVNHDIDSESCNGKHVCSDGKNGLALEKDVLRHVAFERDSETDDFYDPQESMSYTSSTDFEDNTGAVSSVKLIAPTPTGEFFDAWEELSPEAGPRLSLGDIEAELHGIRFNLLMEIEKRKQAEQALNNMQSHWERIREQLSLVGLTLPECPISSEDGLQQLDTNPVEELCQEVYLARFVSESVGRGIAKAEVQIELEAQIEAKNFEIARLSDRLQYYEAVNREMSQRNQEVVEVARRNRQLRKRRQVWIWGSIAAAVTLGTAALAWSFVSAGDGSSSGNDSQVPENKNAAT